MFSCEFCGIFKNIFSYRTPPVAASERDWLYKSSFRKLCVWRMLTNLNMNNNKRKIGLGKKEMLEGKEMFYLQNSFQKRNFKFSRGVKNYIPIICQIFQKVEVAT